MPTDVRLVSTRCGIPQAIRHHTSRGRRVVPHTGFQVKRLIRLNRAFTEYLQETHETQDTGSIRVHIRVQVRRRGMARRVRGAGAVGGREISLVAEAIRRWAINSEFRGGVLSGCVWASGEFPARRRTRRPRTGRSRDRSVWARSIPVGAPCIPRADRQRRRARPVDSRSVGFSSVPRGECSGRRRRVVLVIALP